MRTSTEAERKVSEDTAFQRWVTQPMTKMAISILPPSGEGDVLMTLLRDAFASGIAQGAGSTAVEFMTMVLAKKDKPEQS